MALNPVFTRDAAGNVFPLPMQGEVFILKRDHISFKLKPPSSRSGWFGSDSGTLKGSGCFFLSSLRIVFLKRGNTENHTEFSSCEIPLFLIRDARFKQPVFGANYLEGTVDPLEQAENPIRSSSSFSLTFNAGGCGTFLAVFFRLWKAQTHPQQQTFTGDVLQQLQHGQNAAFVDPTDPSVVYVVQPSPSQGTAGNSQPLLQGAQAEQIAASTGQVSNAYTGNVNAPKPLLPGPA